MSTTILLRRCVGQAADCFWGLKAKEAPVKAAEEEVVVEIKVMMAPVQLNHGRPTFMSGLESSSTRTVAP
jgi:hypothetical protein